MAGSGEHKTVQASILACAQEIGWRYVPCAKGGGTAGREMESARQSRSISVFGWDKKALRAT